MVGATVVRYSFGVGLFHSFLDAGLSRRSRTPPPNPARRTHIRELTMCGPIGGPMLWAVVGRPSATFRDTTASTATCSGGGAALAGPALSLIGASMSGIVRRGSPWSCCRRSTRLVEPEGNFLVVATRDEPAEALFGGTGIVRLATQLPNLLDGGLDVVDVEVGHDLPGLVARMQPGSSSCRADHCTGLTHGLERPPQKRPVETLRSGRVRHTHLEPRQLAGHQVLLLGVAHTVHRLSRVNSDGSREKNPHLADRRGW
jgi:hypothetical protein